MNPSRLVNFSSSLRSQPGGGVNVGVALYSTHRTQWKSSVNRLYGQISKVSDPKSPIHPILDRWIQQGRPVDKPTLVTIIKELKHFNRLNHALQVSMWMTDKRYFDLTHSDVAVRLDLIAKVHGIEQAETYFDSIPQQLKVLAVYRALLNCYAHAKLIDKAESTMQKIRDLGMATSAAAYNNLLSLYYRIGMRDKLDVLVDEMEEKGVWGDKYTYGIRLSAYAAASDFDAVDQILAKLETLPDGQLDWMNYAGVASVYIKARNEDKALAMLKNCEEMIPSSERKREAYEHFIPQYAALDKKDDVFRVWELYKGQMKVYNKGYKIMITSLLKMDDIDSAEKIFDEWETKHSATYDIRIPNHLIAAYTRKGLLNKAEAIIDRIIKKGVKPDAKSWCSLARLYLAHDQKEKAVELTRRSLLAVRPGWKTDKDIWTACLKYLVNKPDPEGAKEYMKLLIDKNIITETGRRD